MFVFWLSSLSSSQNEHWNSLVNVQKTDYAFEHRSFSIPCILKKSNIPNKIAVKVQINHISDILSYLEEEIHIVASKNTVLHNKIDNILQQLVDYPPNEIKQIKNILNKAYSYGNIENSVKVLLYQTFSNYQFYIDFNNEYLKLFQSYYMAIQSLKENRPILVYMKYFKKDDLYITEISFSDESYVDECYRAINNIYNTINNWRQITEENEDPISFFASQCYDYDKSINIMMNYEKNISIKNNLQ